MAVPRNVVAPLIDAARLAREVPTRSLHDATALDVARGLVRDARATGLAAEARSFERAAETTAAELRRFDSVERELVRQGRGLRTLTEGVAAANPPSSPELGDILARVGERDRIEIGLRAERLMVGRTTREAAAVENNLAGAVREIVSKQLPEIQAETQAIIDALRVETTRSGTLSVIDSGRYGTEEALRAVELPGRRRSNERAIRLGTDRIVGTGRAESTVVAITWSDGTSDSVRIAGYIDISLAIEIKGRTTAQGGIEQLRRLRLRGQPGYAVIGGELWLLRYDPGTVRHILVAAPGPELTAAANTARELTAAGFQTRVVEIPRRLDDQIRAFARGYLEAAAGRPARRPR